MLYDLVDIVKNDVSILYWLKSCIYESISKHMPINIEEILNANSKYREADIKGIISLLIKMEIFSKQDKQTEITDQRYLVYTDRLEQFFLKVFAVIEYFEQEKTRKARSSYQIVAKLPHPSISFNDYMKIKRQTLLLYDAVVKLFERAQNEIIIINPFFDAQGIEMLYPELISGLKRKVNIVVITRYDGEKNKRNKQVLDNLIESVKSNSGAIRYLKLYRYVYKNSGYKSSTFHAKAVIVDGGTAAYIGSANLTGWGLDEQFELGTLIEDTNAKLIYNIYEYLQKEGILNEVFI